MQLFLSDWVQIKCLRLDGPEVQIQLHIETLCSLFVILHCIEPISGLILALLCCCALSFRSLSTGQWWSDRVLESLPAEFWIFTSTVLEHLKLGSWSSHTCLTGSVAQWGTCNDFCILWPQSFRLAMLSPELLKIRKNLGLVSLCKRHSSLQCSRPRQLGSYPNFAGP